MPRVSGMFHSQSESMILESIRALRESWVAARQNAYTELLNLYDGGYDKCVQYLSRHEGEVAAAWAERKSRWTNPNYFARFVDAIVDGVWGDPVKREIDGATESQTKILDGILSRNQIDALQRQYGTEAVLLGEGWVNVAARPERESVGLFAVHAGNVWYQCDPNDPCYVTDVVEWRPHAKALGTAMLSASDETGTFWIADAETLWEVDQDGHTVTPKFAHGYGLVPYVRFMGRKMPGYDDGVSVVRDLVSLQKQNINRASNIDTLILFQAHAQLVLTAYSEPEVKVGPRTFLFLPAAQGVDAKYIQPNAPIDDVLRVHQHELQVQAEIVNVPLSVLRGDDSTSGTHLRLKWRPFERMLLGLKTTNAECERNLVRCVCAVGAAIGLGLPRDNVEVTVEFAASTIQTDEAEHELGDQRSVDAGLMTKKDYWRRNRPDIPEEELDAYKAEVEAEAKANEPASPFLFGGPGEGEAL